MSLGPSGHSCIRDAFLGCDGSLTLWWSLYFCLLRFVLPYGLHAIIPVRLLLQMDVWSFEGRRIVVEWRSVFEPRGRLFVYREGLWETLGEVNLVESLRGWGIGGPCAVVFALKLTKVFEHLSQGSWKVLNTVRCVDLAVSFRSTTTGQLSTDDSGKNLTKRYEYKFIVYQAIR